MKTHYIISRVYDKTACGLEVSFFMQATTWKESVTCKNCLRRLDSYTEQYNAALEKWENTTNEELFVMTIETALGLWSGESSKAELISGVQALLQRLVKAGFIRKPDMVEFDWWWGHNQYCD